MRKQKIHGPFPSYADNPAWEVEACVIGERTYAILPDATPTLTASAGMVAQGDTGPIPRPGVYQTYPYGIPSCGDSRAVARAKTDGRAVWVRELTEQEIASIRSTGSI
jgi:hypothetical protein